MADRSWSIDVEQGAVEVASVDLLHDSEGCKVFIIRPKEPRGFADRVYAHAACYAVLIGRYGVAAETRVALRHHLGGWQSVTHVAADGAIWVVYRYDGPTRVWEAEGAKQ